MVEANPQRKLASVKPAAEILRLGALGRLFRQVVLDHAVTSPRGPDRFPQFEVLVHLELLKASDEQVLDTVQVAVQRIDVFSLVLTFFHAAPAIAPSR